MTFINEKISFNDWKKYEFDSQKMKRNGSGTPQMDWAIDRERDVWIRIFNETRDRDNNGKWDNITTWDYYWKGLLLSVKTFLIDSTFTENSNFYHFKLLSINIPNEYKSQKTIILHDFEKALSTYGLYGIHSDGNKKTVKLDYKDVETSS